MELIKGASSPQILTDYFSAVETNALIHRESEIAFNHAAIS
jgi:hypothetical protein